MKLNGGLRTDERFVDIPNGSWVDAKNILLQKGFQSISNENGNTLVKLLDGQLINGVIPTSKDISVIFSVGSNFSQIGIIDAIGTYTTIIHDSQNLFNFSILNPIEGVFKFNYKGDLIIAWCDGINSTSQSPKLLNLSDLPFEVNGSFELINSNDINLAKIFPNVLVPITTIDSVNPNGGQLKAGVYYFTIAYEIENSDLSNYLLPSLPVAAGTIIDDTNPNPNLWNDAAPGINTSTSINLTITNLDLTYKFFRLVVVSKINSIISAIEIGRFATNTDLDVNNNGKFVFVYGGKEGGTTIDLSTIFVNNATYSKAKAIDTLEGRLYFMNVETNSILNFQKYANNIKIKYGAKYLPFVDGDTFKPNVHLTNYSKYRGFQPEEIYAKYIHLVLKDGSVTGGFHIPGRIARQSKVRFGNRVNYTAAAPFGGSVTITCTGWKSKDISSDIFVTPNIFIVVNGTTYSANYVTGLTSTTLEINVTTPFTQPSTGVLDILYGLGSETNLISSINSLLPITPTTEKTLLDSNSKIFQLFDTSDDVDDTNFNGLMGYWENENELYPNTDDFDIWGKYNASLANVNVSLANQYINFSTLPLVAGNPDSNYITTLRNTKVRHHKYPGHNNIQTISKTSPAVLNVRLGFEPYNIIIPPEIENLIQGYYFSYAKRDTNNRTIIGNDILVENPVTNDYGNSYDFTLLTTKPALLVDYIKQLYRTNGVSNKDLFPLLEDNFNRVENLEYHPDNNSATIPSNASRAENISFRYKTHSAISYDISNSAANTSIINLCKYLKNIYLSFYSQQDLCSTGKLNLTNGSNIYSLLLNTIFGGDTFTSENTTNIDANNVLPYLTYGSYDIGFREKDLSAWSLYAYNHYQYNKDFSSLGDIKQPTSFNPFTPLVNKFPYRIPRSIVSADEALSVGWRTFLFDAYFEMPKDKGEGWLLKHLNKELLIQMKYSLFSAKVKDKLANNGAETYLGVGDIFDREPDEIIATEFGYIGSQSQWASFVCKIGYLCIDKEQGKIFIYDGKIKEISDNGNKNFFKRFLNNTNNSTDNPFYINSGTGGGLTAGYDEKNERIIICKRDLTTNTSLAISYSIRDNIWICKHDYIPNYIFSTRNKFFFVQNIVGSPNKGRILEHNTNNNGKFFNITDYTLYSSYIDVVFKNPQQISKIFDSVNWKSEIINSSGVNLKDKTITHIMVYNTTQCSGIISINTTTGSWFTPNCINVQETWKFNDFQDDVKIKTNPFLDSNNQVISSNINTNKNWFEKSLFIDKFVIVRFIYDNVVNNNIYISDVDITTRDNNE